jgi:hypothetical protein
LVDSLISRVPYLVKLTHPSRGTEGRRDEYGCCTVEEGIEQVALGVFV